jgi:hypothetical protein
MRHGVPAALCLFVAACSTPTNAPIYDDSDQPPLNLTFTTEPVAGPDGVPLDATVIVQFDDFPDPDTVSFGPILLRSGRVNFDAELKVDLAHQQVRINGRAAFQPNTTYEVVVDTTVASFSQRTQAADSIWTFTTGTTRANLPPLPKVTWSDILNNGEPALPSDYPGDACPQMGEKSLGGCAPYCHTTCGYSGSMRNPTRRLDLSDPNDPVYGLINVPSVDLAGTAAQIARVTPGDSARSLLLRKLLGGGDKPTQYDAPYPLLRAGGRRMPIGNCDADPATGDCLAAADPTDYFVHPLPFAVIELVQRWIDDGAQVP